VADTEIILHSPNRSYSVLASPHHDQLSQWQGWRFLSRLHHGEHSRGDWRLSVKTTQPSEAKITKWTLALHGIPAPEPGPEPSPNLRTAVLVPSLPRPVPAPDAEVPLPPPPIVFPQPNSWPPFQTVMVVAAGTLLLIGFFYAIYSRYWSAKNGAV